MILQTEARDTARLRVPVIAGIIAGLVFFLFSAEPKPQLFLILLLLGAFALIALSTLGFLRRALLLGLGSSAIINPAKYFFVSQESLLFAGSASYFFITLLDLITFSLLAGLAGRIVCSARTVLPKALGFPIALFFFFLGLSMIQAGDQQAAWAQLFFEARCLALFLCVALLCAEKPKDRASSALRPLWYGLCIGISLECAVVLAEYLHLIPADFQILGVRVKSFNESLSGGAELLRVGGTYRHPNYLAVPSAALLLAFWHIQTDSHPGTESPWPFWGALFAAFLCTLLPASRGGWLGAFCGGLVYLILMLRVRGMAWFRLLPWDYIVPALVVLTIVLGFFSGAVYDKLFLSSPVNISARENLNDMALEMIEEHPFLGVGAGNHSQGAEGHHQYALYAKAAGHPPVVHNIYLLISSEIGIPGAACYFAIPLLCFAFAVRACRRNPNHALVGLLCALCGGALAFLVADLFGPSLRKTEVVFLYWIFLGMITGITYRVNAETTSLPDSKTRGTPHSIANGLSTRAWS